MMLRRNGLFVGGFHGLGHNKRGKILDWGGDIMMNMYVVGKATRGGRIVPTGGVCGRWILWRTEPYSCSAEGRVISAIVDDVVRYGDVPHGLTLIHIRHFCSARAHTQFNTTTL